MAIQMERFLLAFLLVGSCCLIILACDVDPNLPDSPNYPATRSSRPEYPTTRPGRCYGHDYCDEGFYCDLRVKTCKECRPVDNCDSTYKYLGCDRCHKELHERCNDSIRQCGPGLTCSEDTHKCELECPVTDDCHGGTFELGLCNICYSGKDEECGREGAKCSSVYRCNDKTNECECLLKSDLPCDKTYTWDECPFCYVDLHGACNKDTKQCGEFLKCSSESGLCERALVEGN